MPDVTVSYGMPLEFSVFFWQCLNSYISLPNFHKLSNFIDICQKKNYKTTIYKKIN